MDLLLAANPGGGARLPFRYAGLRGNFPRCGQGTRIRVCCTRGETCKSLQSLGTHVGYGGNTGHCCEGWEGEGAMSTGCIHSVGRPWWGRPGPETVVVCGRHEDPGTNLWKGERTPRLCDRMPGNEGMPSPPRSTLRARLPPSKMG